MQFTEKLRYFEKATKIWKNISTFFDLVSNKIRRFFQIFVAFSEYLNFNALCIKKRKKKLYVQYVPN